jgi:hypothetical protein
LCCSGSFFARFTAGLSPLAQTPSASSEPALRKASFAKICTREPHIWTFGFPRVRRIFSVVSFPSEPRHQACRGFVDLPASYLERWNLLCGAGWSVPSRCLQVVLWPPNFSYEGIPSARQAGGPEVALITQTGSVRKPTDPPNRPLRSFSFERASGHWSY